MPGTVMLKLKGTLHLGPTGTGGIDLSAQITHVGIPQTVTRDSAITVLTGDLIQPPAVYSYNVTGQMLLDDSSSGCFSFIQANRGLVLPFTMTPATPSILAVGGTITNDGLSFEETESGKAIIGKYTWPVNGMPTFTFATMADAAAADAERADADRAVDLAGK